jgi:hypothetical protein
MPSSLAHRPAWRTLLEPGRGGAAAPHQSVVSLRQPPQPQPGGGGAATPCPRPSPQGYLKATRQAGAKRSQPAAAAPQAVRCAKTHRCKGANGALSGSPGDRSPGQGSLLVRVRPRRPSAAARCPRSSGDDAAGGGSASLPGWPHPPRLPRAGSRLRRPRRPPGLRPVAAATTGEHPATAAPASPPLQPCSLGRIAGH